MRVVSITSGLGIGLSGLEPDATVVITGGEVSPWPVMLTARLPLDVWMARIEVVVQRNADMSHFQATEIAAARVLEEMGVAEGLDPS